MGYARFFPSPLAGEMTRGGFFPSPSQGEGRVRVLAPVVVVFNLFYARALRRAKNLLSADFRTLVLCCASAPRNGLWSSERGFHIWLILNFFLLTVSCGYLNVVGRKFKIRSNLEAFGTLGEAGGAGFSDGFRPRLDDY